MNKEIFNREKLTSLCHLSKELMDDSGISWDGILFKLFWDSYEDALLRVKALPDLTSDLEIAYTPYEEYCTGHDRDGEPIIEIDYDTYTFRIVVWALRRKGRRTKLFKERQAVQLALQKPIYQKIFTDKITQLNL